MNDVNKGVRGGRFLNATKLEGVNVRHYNGSLPTKAKSFQDFAEDSCQGDVSKATINRPMLRYLSQG